MIATANRVRPGVQELWLPGEARAWPWDIETGKFVDPTGTKGNPSGVKIDHETSLRSTTFLRCVALLSESMASLPRHLMRRLPSGASERATAHPYYRLLGCRPNRWQTSWEWVQQAMLHLTTSGNAYSLKTFSADSLISGRPRVQSLEPLHPTRMKPTWVDVDGVSRLQYVFTEPDGSKTPYHPDQILHIRWLTDNGIEGMVPVELARDAIGLSRACEIHGAAFFGNGARPGLVLKTDAEDLSKETKDEIRYVWERSHRGPERAHRPVVLTGGLTPEIIDGNNQESQFLETRSFQAAECCRLLGVPPHMVGLLDRSTNNNIEAQGREFLTYTLMAWIERFCSAVYRDLLDDEGEEYYLRFDTSALLMGDSATRMAFYHTGIQDGILSQNECRDREGLNPVEGGDNRYIGLNMQPLVAAAGAPGAPGGATEAPGAPSAPADQGGIDKGKVDAVLAVCEQVKSGLLTRDAGVALLSLALPGAGPDAIRAIVGGVQAMPAPEQAPPPPAAPPSPPVTGKPASRSTRQRPR